MNITNSLIFRYLQLPALGLMLLSNIGVKAEVPSPYSAHFDPDKGFKPVQSNLSKTFLQLAGSLEHFGTPEPYIRHIIAEHARIDAQHHATGGKGSSRPDYLTDDYVENLIANWNKIAPPLELNAFCRDAGRNIRYAILGTKNMAPPELVTIETQLDESEEASYRTLLEKQYFKKSDFPAMEEFYAQIFEKLTETGKDQISRRTRLGTLEPKERAKALAEPATGTALVDLLNEHQDKTVAFLENPNSPKATADTLQATLLEALKLDKELDLPSGLRAFEAEPLIYAHAIRSEYMRRIEAVRKTAQTPKQADMIEKAMRLMLENLIVIAQSEFEAGLYEKAAK